MPRRNRHSRGGLIYHVANFADDGRRLFRTPNDYSSFEEILGIAARRLPVKILSYSLLPSHWHLAVATEQDGDLSRFAHWITLTHAHRWRSKQANVLGHLYRERYRSFPVEDDAHFLILSRYIERHAVDSHLVAHADEWLWSSFRHRRTPAPAFVSSWPMDMPPSYPHWVDARLSNEEEWRRRIMFSIQTGMPFGSTDWTSATAEKIGLSLPLRPRGRPPKKITGNKKIFPSSTMYLNATLRTCAASP